MNDNRPDVRGGEPDPMAAVAELSVKLMRRIEDLEERLAALEQGKAA